MINSRRPTCLCLDIGFRRPLLTRLPINRRHDRRKIDCVHGLGITLDGLSELQFRLLADLKLTGGAMGLEFQRSLF